MQSLHKHTVHIDLDRSETVHANPKKLKIFKQIDNLAERNHTAVQAIKLKNYINEHWNSFSLDYQCTSKKERYSSGKVEKELFPLVAAVCGWSNADGNSKDGSNIMISLGYLSYRINPKRFHQKIENILKKQRKNAKTTKKSLKNRTNKRSKVSKKKEVQKEVESPASSVAQDQNSHINKDTQNSLLYPENAFIYNHASPNDQEMNDDILSLPDDSIPFPVDCLSDGLSTVPEDIDTSFDQPEITDRLPNQIPVVEESNVLPDDNTWKHFDSLSPFSFLSHEYDNYGSPCYDSCVESSPAPSQFEPNDLQIQDDVMDNLCNWQSSSDSDMITNKCDNTDFLTIPTPFEDDSCFQGNNWSSLPGLSLPFSDY